MKNVIFLVGLPGSGKSTLSAELGKVFNASIISSNTLIKSIQKSEQYELFNNFIKKGKKIDNNTYIELIQEYILNNSSNVYIIEGFPYDMAQLKASEQMIKNMDLNLMLVIYLEVDYETIIERINNRSVCPVCNTSYDKRGIFCTTCNIPTVVRNDDTNGCVEKRIQSQQLEMAEILEYYDRQKRLLKISDVSKEKSKLKLILENLK